MQLPKITRSEAVRLATLQIPAPRRIHGQHFTLDVPLRPDALQGPRTELSASSYAEALAVRRQKVAEIALALMGLPWDRVSQAPRKGTMTDVVVAALKLACPALAKPMAAAARHGPAAACEAQRERAPKRRSSLL